MDRFSDMLGRLHHAAGRLAMKVHALGMAYVKCTGFLAPERVQVTHDGIAGDRQFVLLNERGEAVAPQDHGPFLPLQFHFDSAANSLRLDYPGGRTVQDNVELSPASTEINFLGLRSVTLREVLGRWERLLTEFAGKPTRLFHCERAGSGIDIKPLTILTTGALRELEQHFGSSVDPRRFRANLVIESHSNHAIEDEWAGKLLRCGEALLRVGGGVPRCIVTQFNPTSGSDDQAMVKALQSYRPRVSLPDGLAPSYSSPGFAAYATVVEPGSVAKGDKVAIVV